MGKITWQQRLAGWLETPLTEKREHQPFVYKATNLVAMAGAYGWTGAALWASMGWVAAPFYLALAGASHLLYRSYLNEHIGDIKPFSETPTSINQTVSMVMPLTEDIGLTYMRQAGCTNICKVGFNDKSSYCHIVSANQRDYSIAFSADRVIEHYDDRRNQLGSAEGTSQFIREQTAVMAHEQTHMSRPRWEVFCNYPAMKIACLAANPLLIIAAVAGFAAVPSPLVGLLGLGAFGAVHLCQAMASRAEEYRADRGAIEKHGTAAHLGGMFTSRMPSLWRAFHGLTQSHPNFAQRNLAMQSHAEQLTPLERASGAVRMANIYSEIASRHAHMFAGKPAEANPEGVLRPVRRAAIGLM